jgi:phosphoenolpyruvate-protein phosphotransferase (PTS system enzyme I)
MIARQFDEMEDEYLRERKADLEQVVERVLRAHERASLHPVTAARRTNRTRRANPRQQDLLLDDTVDVPLILIAHDLSPGRHVAVQAERVCRVSSPMWVGKTSHTAIVARSMDIPAVVGAR